MICKLLLLSHVLESPVWPSKFPTTNPAVDPTPVRKISLTLELGH
jgi:hypothetical protein